MIDLIGNVVTLNDKKYLVLGKTEINNRELYIILGITSDPPLKVELMEAQESKLYPGDKGELRGGLYTGKDSEELIQKYTDIIWEVLAGNSGE
jgi:hypothetical protein